MTWLVEGCAVPEYRLRCMAGHKWLAFGVRPVKCPLCGGDVL